MKTYISPAIELVLLDTEDILTSSTTVKNDHYSDEPVYWNLDVENI